MERATLLLSNIPDLPPAHPRVEERYALSPLQQGMLYHWLVSPQSGVDIEQTVCILREAVKVELLREAWRTVTERHAVLRTGFRWDPQPLQEVWNHVEIPFATRDLQVMPSEDQDGEIEKFLQADRRSGFSLSRAPLQRVTVFQRGPEEFHVVWSYHHAILDGRSIPLVLREVFAVYEGLLRGAPVDLPLPRPFRDYIAWREHLDVGGSERFWRERLRDFRAPTPIRVEGLADCSAEPRHMHRHLRIPNEVSTALTDLAKREGLTWNTLLQGAWAILLSRYSGERDVVFGGARACRHSTVPGADMMVGLFMNTLPVRVTVDPGAQILAWLQALREQWIAMREHEQVPLASIQGWSEVPAGEALFRTAVTFEHREMGVRVFGEALGREEEEEEEEEGEEEGEEEHRGWKSKREIKLNGQTNFALTLAGYGPDPLLRLRYDRQRFSDATIDRMLGHLGSLLSGIAQDPHRTLGDLVMMTPEEQRSLTLDLNAGDAELQDSEETLHALFARQAAACPNAVALTCGEEQLTYGELDQRSSQLAAHLAALGVHSEVIVALCIPRSIDLIVALLAILKAGGAYLPIDLAYPPERVSFIIEDAAAPVLLTCRALVSSLPIHSAHVVCLDEWTPDTAAVPVQENAPDSLAYVIYTSGSTGKPKGCQITHRNVVRLFPATAEWFRFNESDVWTMFHSVAFDFSVWEVWGALLHGGRLVIVPHEVSRSPDAFHELLVREQVTVLNQTPSAFRQLIAADQGSARSRELALRVVIFGGEALEVGSLAPWWARHGDQHPQLVNMYGITETTVHVTYRPLRRSDAGGGSVIGIPIPDLQVYILDPQQRPVPIGVPGEMYVGGAGVARGYLRRPELTMERFVKNPFLLEEEEEGEARLYRTGDLARWLPGRDIEYLGRADQQVKIRGFRIELGEVQSVLEQHSGVRESVVIAQSANGDTRLAAFYVPLQAPVPLPELRAHLKTRLPDYMIPASFVVLDALPLTTNGKVDLRALPAPGIQTGDEPSAHAVPRTVLEKSIAQIWRSLLHVDQVGVDSNFFDLGGHSLLLIQLHARLRALGPDAPAMTELFQYPTIRALAQRMSQSAPATGTTLSIHERAQRQRAASQAAARLRLHPLHP